MKLVSSLVVLALSNAVFGVPVENPQSVLVQPPSQVEGASVARTLVYRESLTNVNTVKRVEKSDGSTRYLPVSSMEYYADCGEDGDPYLLIVDIGSTFQNIVRGSDYSLTIRVGDHPDYETVNSSYPGGISSSPAGSPRVQLTGKLVNVSFRSPLDAELLKLEACFLKRHPDARLWLPNNIISPHRSHWSKFVVEDVYLVGGFGNQAYIGPIDGDLYHSVGTLPDE
ncbi:pyridoxamine 5'-phosphate oxidase-domain-containing protein [Scheffersomyces xylosifermentans]|uniref:pyridoxamine 5'-phosphate oxidase-domain-containing protein n=1 Tax=Scheffersomyces xylosifermentans TaxID=1304137 RepID=UPI00315CDBA6